MIHIINGPNLNLLGIRQVEIYGTRTFEDYFQELQTHFCAIDLHYFQSNSEGAIIDMLHQVGFSAQGIILNPGAYAHSSYAITDAITAIETPVVEVHISNIYARENFRKQSYTAGACIGVISGLGLDGYRLGIEWLVRK